MLDGLISKLQRDETDLQTFKQANPTEEELIVRLQRAIDFYRPPFEGEKRADMMAITRRLWHDLFGHGTVGWAHKHIGASDYQRAFWLPPGVTALVSTSELPGLPGQSTDGTWQSCANGVNGCAQVVGRAQDTGGNFRAFFFKQDDTALTELNTVSLVGGSTPASQGWNLISAVGISDADHIVGTGTHNSATRQWMMYPTPQE